eukprot:UN00699
MTTVLIGKTPLFECVQRLEVSCIFDKSCAKMSQNHISNFRLRYF